MATLHRSAEAAEAGVRAEAALLNNGFIDIYAGTIPATVATAIGAQTKLARLTLAATAFVNGGSDGVVTAGAIGDGTGLANGTASFARWCKSDGTAVYDTDVTLNAGTGFLKLNTLAIAVSDVVTAVASGTITAPLS